MQGPKYIFFIMIMWEYLIWGTNCPKKSTPGKKISNAWEHVARKNSMGVK